MKSEQEAIDLINKQIIELHKLRAKLQPTQEPSTFQQLLKSNHKWVLNLSSGMFFRAISFGLEYLTITRNGIPQSVTIDNLNTNFRCATSTEAYSLENKDSSINLNQPKTTIDTFINHSTNNWVIEIAKNKYYQVMDSPKAIKSAQRVHLKRKGLSSWIRPSVFNEEYRCATSDEAKKHEAFLWSQEHKITFNKNIGPNPKCDFYMITCKGVHGTKVRHATYDLALQEAKRISSKEEAPAYILGVVATVSPNSI